MSDFKVPFIDLVQRYAEERDEIMACVDRVLSKGHLVLTEELTEFEQQVCDYTGAKHCIGLNSGTDALMIGLWALGIGKGDEVITTPVSFVATAGAIAHVGATPVFADVKDDQTLDPQAIEKAITPRTKAIMPVQVNGRTCDMDALQAVADKHGIMIVEDAAQGLGSKFNGRAAGTFGKFGTISFYPAKLLGCFGDGGAVVTNDDAVAEAISLLRDHGRNADGRVVAWGYNSRLDNVQAAVLNHKFKTFPQEIGRRRAIAAAYQAGLGDLPQVTLPPAPDADARHFDVYQNYEMEADRRDDLRAFLDGKGIKTIIQWAGTPVHQFKDLGFTVSLPKTDEFFERCVMLPMNTAITDEQVQTVIRTIREFYGA